jgi:hypothetical protein
MFSALKAVLTPCRDLTVVSLRHASPALGPPIPTIRRPPHGPLCANKRTSRTAADDVPHRRRSRARSSHSGSGALGRIAVEHQPKHGIKQDIKRVTMSAYFSHATCYPAHNSDLPAADGV